MSLVSHRPVPAILLIFLLGFASGCQPPPAPPAPLADEQYSVSMPSVQETMPARSSRPETRNVPVRTIAMRFDSATQLVQTTSDGPEVIPTPKGIPESAKAIREAELAQAAAKEAAALKAAVALEKAAQKNVPQAVPQAAKPQSPTRPAAMDLKPAAPETAPPKTADAETAKPDSPEPAFIPALPESYETWDKPKLTLVFTGNQHGYIEPCGCTGLERQKGGVARRFSFLETLREKGWPIVPMDAGNQVRRFGRQAAIKMQQSVRALTEMKYEAVGFGPEDIRLGVGDLLAVAASDSAEDALYVSANVVLFDPEMLPQTKLIVREGIKLGITSITDPKTLEIDPGEELTVGEMLPATRAAMKELSAKSPDFTVLLFFGKEDAAKNLVRQVPGFDLVVVAGGYGEPTYQAASIEESKTKMILTGNKGMYAGLVGLYLGSEMKYARVALTHELADAPPMRALMKDYQDQLRDVGFSGLGLMPPIPHSSGNQFVGTATCGKCHTEALDIWENSPHADATDSIVAPPQDRGDVPRHFDPECISCHVTGWNPQEYYPYETGYLSIESTPHLTGSGCENCHGPGAEHAAAEEPGSTIASDLRDQLRDAMRLPLEKAREKCMNCHDLDNSPDFHEPDAFLEEYWPQIEHYGME